MKSIIGIMFTIIIFILLMRMGVPNEFDMAKTTAETIQESVEPNSLAYETAQATISALEILKVVIIIVTVFAMLKILLHVF